MYLVVCYDVVSDRRRRRLSDRLEKLVVRVQKSVFEGRIQPRNLEKIRKAAIREIDLETDGVRIYFLCKRCRQATEIIGTGTALPGVEEDVVV